MRPNSSLELLDAFIPELLYPAQFDRGWGCLACLRGLAQSKLKDSLFSENVVQASTVPHGLLNLHQP